MYYFAESFCQRYERGDQLKYYLWGQNVVQYIKLQGHWLELYFISLLCVGVVLIYSILLFQGACLFLYEIIYLFDMLDNFYFVDLAKPFFFLISNCFAWLANTLNGSF